MLKQIQDHAGIEGARPRTHRQTVDRGKAHGAGDASPAVDGAHAGAIAEMGHDELAARTFRRHLRQHRDDVFVGKAVKPVAANALGRQLARQGEFLCQRRLRSVEGRVEAGNLRERGHNGANGADRRDMVGLVQRRERHQHFKCANHPVIDQHRFGVGGAAVHDAMPDTAEGRLAVPVRFKPCVYRLDRSQMVVPRHGFARRAYAPTHRRPRAAASVRFPGPARVHRAITIHRFRSQRPKTLCSRSRALTTRICCVIGWPRWLDDDARRRASQVRRTQSVRAGNRNGS